MKELEALASYLAGFTFEKSNKPEDALRYYDEALGYGLVSRVCPDDELLAQTLELANRIAGQSPIAISMIKRLVYQSARLDLRTSLDLASSHMGIVQSTHDQAEAMNAFRDKRSPIFQDR